MRTIPPSAGRAVALAILGLLTAVGPLDALAQRPFRVYDPFYRSETARRSFFDGYAATAEISYRAPGSVQDGRRTVSADPFGLSLRFDYQILQQVDLSAIIDAAGSYSGRTLSLSWLALKYYRTVEHSDYAFRLAVDPSFDNRLGFPQVDLAFISTSLLSPVLSSDYAIGVRRVRMGFEQYVVGSEASYVDDLMEPVQPPVTTSAAGDLIFTNAIGWELHVMMQYAFLLDPARSNVFVSLLVDRGQYELWETSLRESSQPAGLLMLRADDDPSALAEPPKRDYRGGVFWARTGFEYNRPSYQVMPFLSIPVVQWRPDEEDEPAGTRARLSLGCRVMLR